MSDTTTLGVFLGAVLILSLTPGPGMLYVLARTLRGGRREGVQSTLGNGNAQPRPRCRVSPPAA